ncbi:MAG TPA: RecX family transcriptional regulator [Alphaproteobacteria bacterium]|jgi:regulatory protein|nr:RecX family transcriptional regulator [Alphaproteobacteria bacterium]
MARSQPKPPKRMTPAALADAALFYLSRFATSSGNLRRVLARKVSRSAAHYGDDPAALMPTIDALVAQHMKTGAVNDTLYAESQVRKLRRRGGSTRIIVQKLSAKGVPAEIVAEAQTTLRDDAGDLEAAMRLAKRRRLGPFRQANRADNRQRDLAALGRAGFEYQVAAAIIDAEDAETLAETIGI